MKWKYVWITNEMSPWTYKQKKDFHKTADSLIWQKLGSSLNMKVRGNSDFAKKHVNTIWKVYFDIKWVLNDEHWTVFVKKIKKDKFSKSTTNWKKKEMYLDTNDFDLFIKGTIGPNKYYQRGVLHEFGHAIGNTEYIKRMNEDAYKQTNSYNNDYSKLMHSAEEIRSRHLDYIISVLNKWIPNTIFEAGSLK